MDPHHIMEALEQAGLDLDDLRWFLAVQVTQSILANPERPQELIHSVWSGELEARLYRMEERWLEDCAREMNQGRTDEAWLNEAIGEIRLAKRRRRGL